MDKLRQMINRKRSFQGLTHDTIYPLRVNSENLDTHRQESRNQVEVLNSNNPSRMSTSLAAQFMVAVVDSLIKE